MTNKTQIEWVWEKLRNYGYVSRNQALKNRITRLSAIIYKFKKGKLYPNISGRYILNKKTKCKDFIYYTCGVK